MSKITPNSSKIGHVPVHTVKMAQLIFEVDCIVAAIQKISLLSSPAELAAFEARLESANNTFICSLLSVPKTAQVGLLTMPAHLVSARGILKNTNDRYLSILNSFDIHYPFFPHNCHPSSLRLRNPLSKLRHTIALFNQSASAIPLPTALIEKSAPYAVSVAPGKKVNHLMGSLLEDMKKDLLAAQAASEAKLRKEIGGLAGMLEKQKTEAAAVQVAHKLQLTTDQRRSSVFEARLAGQERIIQDLVAKLESQAPLLATHKHAGRVDKAFEPDPAEADRTPLGNSTRVVSSDQADLAKGSQLDAGMKGIKDAVSGVIQAISDHHLATISSMAELEAAALGAIEEHAAGQLALIEARADDLDRTMLEFEKRHPVQIPLPKPQIDIIPNPKHFPVSVATILPASRRVSSYPKGPAMRKLCPRAVHTRFDDGPTDTSLGAAIGAGKPNMGVKAEAEAVGQSGKAMEGWQTKAEEHSASEDALLFDQAAKLCLADAAAEQLFEAQKEETRGDDARRKGSGEVGVHRETVKQENAKEKLMEMGKSWMQEGTAQRNTTEAEAREELGDDGEWRLKFTGWGGE